LPLATMLDQLLTTIIKRPYVFAFLAAYLFLALRRFGWKRTLLWLVSGYLIAWLSEYSSIHNGFPYGHYKYVYENMPGELMVAGVPFFDSLSYVFLTFAGFMTGRFVIEHRLSLRAKRSNLAVQTEIAASPSRAPRDDNWKIALKLVVFGAFLTMMLDVIIDPVATMGAKWFLGEIHYYVHPGFYFGVPLTNFGGWFLVAFAIIGFNVVAWKAFPNFLGGLKMRDKILPLEPFLYLSVGIFQTVMAFVIGAYLLGCINATLCVIVGALLPHMNGKKKE